MMAHLGCPERHFWLTRSVARVMGVNLSDAMANQQLTADGYANLVTTCRGCLLVSQCERWLARQADTTHEPPPNCLNADALKTLSVRH